ncbi:MAG TPA: DMT family transporter [Acidimicrobiales bacterium]|nr:DMT family transporter [Acidimicrobiales bacterium]
MSRGESRPRAGNQGHVVAIATGLAAALFIAVGFVLQQHAAAQEPPDERLSFRLLAHLMRRPLWLGGIGCMVAGQLFGAVALDQGSLALVEPLVASNLLFALPLSAVWHRRRIGRRDWAAAACLLAGLTAFVVAGDPFGGSTVGIRWSGWLGALGGIAAVAAVLVVLGRKVGRVREVSALAGAAGVLYGVQDALTQRVEVVAQHDVLRLVTSWPAFLLVAIAVVALLLNQSAFEAGPLAQSLPPVTMAEPLAGIAFGVGVYREHLNLGWPWLPIELAGVAAMILGVTALASSPVVCGVDDRVSG